MYASFEHPVTEPGPQESYYPKADKKYDYSTNIFGAVLNQPIVEIFVKIVYFINILVFHKQWKQK